MEETIGMDKREGVVEPRNFGRKELWEIRERAHRLSKIVANEGWKKAHSDLAYAADVLDAFFGRSSIGIPDTGEEKS